MIKKSYIPKLDDFLDGGIPQGHSIMFSAHPGIDCEIFGYEMLNGRVEDDDKGFIFTNVTEPDAIKYTISTSMDGTLTESG